ncbi:hypothetical protein [Paludisphaera soli]|uniref:hypothetical protein n=1 Tax=Paludisphaera soli TaxID=2712865 RepID=UPI0013ED7F02|nr:hypothetical protein [Paludisphaera soli]
MLESDGPTVLDAADAFLAAAAEQVERTRRGRAWNIRIDGRPVHVEVTTSPPAIGLSAGCNGAEDDEVLRRLASGLAAACGGVPSEPVK